MPKTEKVKKVSLLAAFPHNEPAPSNKQKPKKVSLLAAFGEANKEPAIETVPIPAEDFEEYLAFKFAHKTEDQ